MDCSEGTNTDRSARGRTVGHDDSPGAAPRASHVTSRALFRGAELLHIEHEGQTYILRKTRQGKLILNK
ncbi:hemin uptake protein HemP [Wenzhouxiangella sp. XN24]|uniref:hemin uptake protein HemP n=1 Tax=Wenzhouxiangella sp. XN24 TaxID=2713569 RepID=UPI0013EBFD04|nr:hemin uptake protein HemP [Wenzhouxiangella sp. XN24]NGX16279.1 hemin uptake protein HemP [Wenzhouxiangella sp. XN24]